MREERKETKNKKEIIVEKQEREKGQERLREEHPELIPVDPKVYDSLKKGSRNIKIEFQKAYPGIKWSVRSESYANGCSIDIRWTDGPTAEQVEKISGKYQEGHFDGMIDCYEYNKDDIWTDLYGGAKYVQASRSYSAEAWKWAAKKIQSEWGTKEIKLTASENYYYINQGDDFMVENANNEWASRLVNQALHERDFTKTDEEIEAEEAEEERKFEEEFRASEERRIKVIEEALEKERKIQTRPSSGWSEVSY